MSDEWNIPDDVRRAWSSGGGTLESSGESASVWQKSTAGARQIPEIQNLVSVDDLGDASFFQDFYLKVRGSKSPTPYPREDNLSVPMAVPKDMAWFFDGAASKSLTPLEMLVAWTVWCHVERNPVGEKITEYILDIFSRENDSFWDVDDEIVTADWGVRSEYRPNIAYVMSMGHYLDYVQGDHSSETSVAERIADVVTVMVQLCRAVSASITNCVILSQNLVTPTEVKNLMISERDNIPKSAREFAKVIYLKTRGITTSNPAEAAAIDSLVGVTGELASAQLAMDRQSPGGIEFTRNNFLTMLSDSGVREAIARFIPPPVIQQVPVMQSTYPPQGGVMIDEPTRGAIDAQLAFAREETAKNAQEYLNKQLALHGEQLKAAVRNSIDNAESLKKYLASMMYREDVDLILSHLPVGTKAGAEEVAKFPYIALEIRHRNTKDEGVRSWLWKNREGIAGMLSNFVNASLVETEQRNAVFLQKSREEKAALDEKIKASKVEEEKAKLKVEFANSAYVGTIAELEKRKRDADVKAKVATKQFAKDMAALDEQRKMAEESVEKVAGFMSGEYMRERIASLAGAINEKNPSVAEIKLAASNKIDEEIARLEKEFSVPAPLGPQQEKFRFGDKINSDAVVEFKNNREAVKGALVSAGMLAAKIKESIGKVALQDFDVTEFIKNLLSKKKEEVERQWTSFIASRKNASEQDIRKWTETMDVATRGAEEATVALQAMLRDRENMLTFANLSRRAVQFAYGDEMQDAINRVADSGADGDEMVKLAEKIIVEKIPRLSPTDKTVEAILRAIGKEIPLSQEPNSLRNELARGIVAGVIFKRATAAKLNALHLEAAEKIETAERQVAEFREVLDADTRKKANEILEKKLGEGAGVQELSIAILEATARQHQAVREEIKALQERREVDVAEAKKKAETEGRKAWDFYSGKEVEYGEKLEQLLEQQKQYEKKISDELMAVADAMNKAVDGKFDTWKKEWNLKKAASGARTAGEILTIQARLSTLETAKTEADERFGTLEKKVSELDVKTNELEKKLEGEIETTEKNFKDVLDKVGESAKTVDDKYDLGGFLASEIEKIANQLKDKQKELAAEQTRQLEAVIKATTADEKKAAEKARREARVKFARDLDAMQKQAYDVFEMDVSLTAKKAIEVALEKKNANVRELAKKIESSRLDAELLEKELGALDAKKKLAAAEVSSGVTAQLEQLEGLEEKSRQTKADLDAAKENLGNLQSQLSGLNADLTSFKGTIKVNIDEELKKIADLGALERAKLEDARKKLADLLAEKGKLEKEREEDAGKLAGATEDAKRKNDEYAKLLGEITNHTEEITNLKKRVNDLEEWRTKVEKQVVEGTVDPEKLGAVVRTVFRDQPEVWQPVVEEYIGLKIGAQLAPVAQDVEILKKQAKETEGTLEVVKLGVELVGFEGKETQAELSKLKGEIVKAKIPSELEVLSAGMTENNPFSGGLLKHASGRHMYTAFRLDTLVEELIKRTKEGATKEMPVNPNYFMTDARHPNSHIYPAIGSVMLSSDPEGGNLYEAHADMSQTQYAGELKKTWDAERRWVIVGSKSTTGDSLRIALSKMKNLEALVIPFDSMGEKDITEVLWGDRVGGENLHWRHSLRFLVTTLPSSFKLDSENGFLDKFPKLQAAVIFTPIRRDFETTGRMRVVGMANAYRKLIAKDYKGPDASFGGPVHSLELHVIFEQRPDDIENLTNPTVLGDDGFLSVWDKDKTKKVRWNTVLLGPELKLSRGSWFREGELGAFNDAKAVKDLIAKTSEPLKTS